MTVDEAKGTYYLAAGSKIYAATIAAPSTPNTPATTPPAAPAATPAADNPADTSGAALLSVPPVTDAVDAASLPAVPNRPVPSPGNRSVPAAWARAWLP